MTRTGAANHRGLTQVLEPPRDPSPIRKTSATKRKVDQYEGGGSSDAVQAAPNTPEVHRLVGEYDTRGLRRHLKLNPLEVNTRNAAGDTPLHAIAAKGAALVAEVIDEFSPDHLASNTRGFLPGHLAAEKHPKTAQFCFERALAKEPREPSWHPVKDVAARLAALGGKAPITDAAIDQLAATLTGIPLSELNAPGEVVKNRTHLEAVKGTILDLKAEGWWQDKFVPQRVRALLHAAVEAPKEMQGVFLREISAQLDLLRTVRRVFAMKKCTRENIREMAMRLEASLITSRLMTSKPGEETTLALGWNGHAIYCGLSIQAADARAGHKEDTLLVRVDNLGAGSALEHEKEAGRVYSRAFHVPLAYLKTREGEASLRTLIGDLLIVGAASDSTDDDFYSRLARFKSEMKKKTDRELVESKYGVAGTGPMKPQIAGNCVVENTLPGLAARLGAPAFAWFRDYEQKLARELVTLHADTNKLIDEECKERDKREIGKVLDGAGPWAEKLRAIVDGAHGTYDSATLAKDVSAEQLKKVIEGNDVAALRTLLAHGVKVDLQDSSDMTPLHWAARSGRVEMVTLLLDRHAAVNAMDNEGNTPLHLAVSSGSSAIVTMLLDRGADADRKNKAGVSPRALLAEKIDQTMLIAQALRGSESPEKRTKQRPGLNFS